jgi:orotidine-5'-phosphate decarboxylase
MNRNFNDLLAGSGDQKKFLCVGLDPDFEKIPEAARRPGIRDTLVAFSRAIVDSTADIAAAYKPNSAFFEAYGDEGIAALQEICYYIIDHSPEAAIILDAKRADIGNTNRGYCSFAFDHMRADAITLHPYLGAEALQPFLERKEKGAFILCRTSNPGAREFQDLDVAGEPLYVRVAKNVAGQWNAQGNCGLVVGATYPEEMAKIRAVAPELPFLIPGVGAQGGELEAAVKAAKRPSGGLLLAISRAIMYASTGDDYAQAARQAAQSFDSAIRAAI